MKIASSNIMTADYDKTKRLLRMVFINRPMWVYTYVNVPPHIWAEFVKSKSRGEYFSAIIRDKFRYNRTTQATNIKKK